MADSDQQVRVLLVDDDPRMLSALGRVLRRENLAIETARDAREALVRLAEGPIELVISDQKMPGMSGIELLIGIRKQWPSTARILLSGWSASILPSEIEAAGLSALLSKPWDDAELKGAIRHAIWEGPS